MAVRNVYFMYLIGGIFVSKIFVDFINQYLGKEFLENLSFKLCSSKIIIVLIVLVIIIVSVYNLSVELNKQYVDDMFYPVYAVKWILQNVDTSNSRIWTGFNYGSYLELNGIKVFLDSRSRNVL